MALNLLTADEYLRLERAAPDKHEYADGQMLAMSGASRRHREITDNVLSCFREFRKQGCIPDNSDARIYIPGYGRYTYPDVVLTCGEEQRHQDDVLDTLLNPTLIVEVLSQSTEDYDRGKKFEFYRAIPSFAEYLLISSDRVAVKQRVRVAAREWKQLFFEDRKDVLLLQNHLELAIEAIYEGVTLER